MDPRAVVEPNINWGKIDRNTALQHQLTLQAISWVLADRECDDLSAALTRARDTANPQLEKVQTHFQRACRRVEECDDELRQAARKLVDALEEGSPDDPRTSP
jgi:superfamily II RNA helicase